MQEWIRLNRSFLSWNWFDKPEMLAIFMHLLNSASEEDQQGDTLLHRGQIKTSLNQLVESTEISKKIIRTCLDRLKEWGLIETETSNRHTIISIRNYDEYFEQQKPVEVLKVEMGKTESSSKPKDEKPKKTKEELIADTEKRKKKFYDELVPYVETYGKTMIRRFFDYWSETNKSGSRMRYEQERTWVLNLRLQRWGRHQNDYDVKPTSIALHNSEDKDYNEGGW